MGGDWNWYFTFLQFSVKLVSSPFNLSDIFGGFVTHVTHKKPYNFSSSLIDELKIWSTFWEHYSIVL
jgi:hypothetical protein